MTIKMIPSRPGSARVEYFACREDVEAMLAKGYSAQMGIRTHERTGQGDVQLFRVLRLCARRRQVTSFKKKGKAEKHIAGSAQNWWPDHRRRIQGA